MTDEEFGRIWTEAYRDIDAKLSKSEALLAKRFDRSLLATALAISRDTAVSGGDALTWKERNDE